MANISKKAVFFDLDGTLLNTLYDLGACLNAGFASEGLPELRLEEYRQIVGNGIRTSIRRSAPEGTNEEILRRIKEEFDRQYEAHFMDRTVPYPGIPEFLAQAKKRGLVFAVTTNKQTSFARALIARLLPGHAFALIQGQEDGVPAKPDPAMGRMACEAAGVSPEEVLYIGDSAVDLAFGKACGFCTVGVLWGFRPDELLPSGATRLVSHPAQLLPFLD